MHAVLAELAREAVRLVGDGGGGGGARLDGGVAAEGDQLLHRRLKRLVERRLVLRELLDVGQELLVGLERHVGREHHEFVLRVGVLQRSVPLARLPLELREVLEVRVVPFERIVRPRAVEARPRLVAAAERVRAAQRDDVAVVEAHPVENVAEVLRTLRGVGQSADRRARGARRGVGAAEVVLDLRPARLLDRHAARERPDVGVRQLRELALDRLEYIALDAEAGVRTVFRLRREAHRRAVGAARLVGRAVRAARVPREAHRHRARVRLLVDEALADAGLDRVDVEGGAEYFSFFPNHRLLSRSSRFSCCSKR